MKKSEKPAWLREIATNWRPGDMNLIDVKATGIERAIPPDSQHESAIKAREYAALARRFGISEKGALFLMKAESARKDFELFDGYEGKMKAKADARVASTKPRQKDPLRAKIIEAMAPSKRDADDFKSFMQMWCLGHLDGLTAESIEDGNKYRIADETDDLGEKIYTWGTLKKMYSGN